MSHLSLYRTPYNDLDKLHTALIRCGVPSNKMHRMSEHIIILKGVLATTSVVFQWGGESFECHYDVENWTYELSPEAFTLTVNIEYDLVGTEEFLKDNGFLIESYTDSIDNNTFDTVKAKTLRSTRYNFKKEEDGSDL